MALWGTCTSAATRSNWGRSAHLIPHHRYVFMANWLQRLGQRFVHQASGPGIASSSAGYDMYVPMFATRLAVNSPGAPGLAGAEALYNKWSARWQEF